MQPSDLLFQSDNALQQAFKEGKISHWIDAQQPQKYSREQARTKLVDAINQSHFMFQWQSVSDMPSDDIIQREIYCRLKIDDMVVSASEFMPFIELLSFGGQLDRCLLETLVPQNILDITPQPVAINLTHDSLQGPEFSPRLTRF